MKKVYVFPVCRNVVCRNEILAGSSPHISEEGDVNIGGQSSACLLYTSDAADEL